MRPLDRLPYRDLWCVDFEFSAPSGERPSPICLVARELRSGRLERLWEDELRRRRCPPYSVDADSLVVAFYSSAEWGCHLALGWPLPVRTLDLFVEHRAATNGLTSDERAALLDHQVAELARLQSRRDDATHLACRCRDYLREQGTLPRELDF